MAALAPRVVLSRGTRALRAMKRALPLAGRCRPRACSSELFPVDVEVALRKRSSPSEAGRPDQRGTGAGSWRQRVDAKLAGLFNAALEEPIPDDMLRLARMIGERGPREDGA